MRRLISCAAALCVCLCLMMALPASAQTPTPITISLDSASLELQTGKEYEINIWLDNAADVWLVNAEIAYDPALVYIMGTKSGQPVRQGPLFDINQSIIVRNAVQSNQLIYMLSMLAPGAPVSGSGIIGTFRIYPLAPGDAQLTFSRVTLNKVTQTLDANGTPVSTETEDLPFVPAMIQLKITGNPVPIPSEATATPAPTETPFLATAQSITLEPTLINVTAAPRSTLEATPVPGIASDASEPAASPLPLIAVALVVIGGLGLIVLFVMYRRSRR